MTRRSRAAEPSPLTPSNRRDPPARQLHLLRHAKSSWVDESLDDHDRPLTKRGRRAAEAIADHLARSGLVFDLVLCSTALRARETVEPILARSRPHRIVFDRALYLASAAALLVHLRTLGDEIGSVLVVGHNPGLQELAVALADRRSTAALPPASGKFATGALAGFRFAGPWRALAPRRAALIGYLTPRDLAAAGE